MTVSEQDWLGLEAADSGLGNEDELGHAKGIWRELGDLPPGAIISESALARIFHGHSVSIKRAVQRGELPPPTRLLGQPVWTAGAIIRHLEQRLEAAGEEAERDARRFEELRP